LTQTEESVSAATIVFVRRGLLALTVVSILATAFELYSVAHWQDFEQLIPWAALTALVVATGLSLLPHRWAGIAARVLAIIVLCASGYGVVDHTVVNLGSGPLDYRFTDTWDSMSPIRQWWYAFTKTVGPSPTLAPGALGLAAVLLLLASILSGKHSR
jgi:hypothetical protein